MDCKHLLIALVDCKHCKKIQKFKETGGLNYIYNNELDKACFFHAVYVDSKDLAQRTVSDKILKDKVYKFVLNHNNMDVKENCHVWFIRFLIENRVRYECK